MGTSSSDVFAVGRQGTIIHYNGKAWSTMTSGTTDDILGIWGSSSSDVYTSGYTGTILHYNGKTWSPMVSNSPVIFTRIWEVPPLIFSPWQLWARFSIMTVKLGAV